MQMAYSQTDCLNDLHQQIQNQNIQSEQFQMQVQAQDQQIEELKERDMQNQ